MYLETLSLLLFLYMYDDDSYYNYSNCYIIFLSDVIIQGAVLEAHMTYLIC